MHSSTIVLCKLLFASGISMAQANSPLPPAPWTPFTSASDPTLSGINSIATPPISLDGANLSFEVRIQNPNSKPIRCLATKFLARMGVVGERCQTSPYHIYIEGNDGLGSIEIPGNSTSAVKHLGNKEREESGRALGNIDLEFCSREAWDLDCGYDCGNDDGIERKYSREPWDLGITGGKRRFICEASGKTKRTADPVTCDSGYSADPINDRCLKMCDSIHRAGDTWPRAIDNGNIVYSCLSSGDVDARVSCLQNPMHAVVGETCQPANCGGTQHGERYSTSFVNLGKWTAVCSYGQPIESQLVCDSNAIKENDSCREGRSCEGSAHGTTYSTTKSTVCGSRARDTITTKSCSDGNITVLSTETRDMGPGEKCSSDGRPF